MAITVDLDKFNQYDQEFGRKQISAPTSTKKPKSNLGKVSDWFPVIGGVAGSFVPGLGNIAGGAIGAGIGSLLKSGVKASEGEKVDTGQALGEAGKEALITAAGGKLFEGLGNIGRKVLGGVAEKGAQSVLKATPSMVAKAAEHGDDLGKNFIKYLPGLGNTYDDMIGTVAERRMGGNVGRMISEAEDVIQGTAKAAGNNIRISGDDIVKNLQREARALKSTIGEESRRKALDNVIKEVKKKYANGTTVKKALDTLRNANAKFGASILDDTSDAIATASQKIEANTLRSALKGMFPDIASSLDSQSELIQLREVLKAAAAKQGSGAGFNLGRFDISRPGTFLDAILNNPKIATAVTKGASGVSGTTSAGKEVLKRGAQQTAVRPGLLASGEQQALPADINQVLPGAETTVPEVTTPEPTVGGLTKEQLQKAAEWDLMNNNGKGLAKIQAMMDMLPTAPAQSKLSDTAIGKVNDYTSAINNLIALKDDLSESQGITGPITGFRGVNPYDINAQNLQANIDRVRQIVGKALEGGVLRKEDEEKYKKILPTLRDTPEVASVKIDNLLTQLYTQLENYTTLQNERGGGTFSLPSDISQAITY